MSANPTRATDGRTARSGLPARIASAWVENAAVQVAGPEEAVEADVPGGIDVRQPRHRAVGAGPHLNVVRALAQGNDGFVYAATDQRNGRILRLAPRK